MACGGKRNCIMLFTHQELDSDNSNINIQKGWIFTMFSYLNIFNATLGKEEIVLDAQALKK